MLNLINIYNCGIVFLGGKMKNKIIMGIIIVILTIAVGSLIYAGVSLTRKSAEENSHLIELSFDELQKKVDNKESFILLLSQTTCSHCAEYKPVLKKVLTKYDLVAYELSIDLLSKEENAKLKDIANNSGTPTTVFIVDGEEQNTAHRLVGTTSESKLVSRLRALGYIE